MTEELAAKTAVVTGSSKGIGRTIAIRLAAAGAKVVIHGGSDEDAAQAVASDVAALGGCARVLMADFCTAQSITALVQQAWEWQQGVDIWINNAGADILTASESELTFEQKLGRLWEVDVLGTIRCSRAIGDRMRQAGRGTIINMGWDQAWQGMEGDSGEVFAATKGAIMAFSKSLAKSLAPHVRVNCLAPGWIKTSWGENYASAYWQRRAVQESLRSRWGTPHDVAAAACFLASASADFINGQILPVNGGFRHHRDPASPS